MRAARLLTCLWPGLPALWWQGAMTGVCVAVAFALALNVALIVTFLTPELLSPLAILGVWLVVTACWIIAWVRASRRVVQHPAGEPSQPKTSEEEAVIDPFPAIQLEYLRGNHAEAAEMLHLHLKTQPADADAHILLATLYRHSEKFDDATQQLSKLEQLPSGGKWAMEIYQERQLIAELLELEDEEEDETDIITGAVQDHQEVPALPFPEQPDGAEQDVATADEKPLITSVASERAAAGEDEAGPPSVKAA